MINSIDTLSLSLRMKVQKATIRFAKDNPECNLAGAFLFYCDFAWRFEIFKWDDQQPVKMPDGVTGVSIINLSELRNKEIYRLHSNGLDTQNTETTEQA